MNKNAAEVKIALYVRVSTRDSGQEHGDINLSGSDE
jgi:hypothetical protein